METKKCTICGIEKPLSDYPRTYHNETSRRSNCKQCENKRRKHSYDKNPISRLMMNAKARARLRKIEFNLGNDDVVIPEKCPLLGIKFELGEKDNYAYSPSIDRKDPSKGYVKGNVWVISCKANMMKTNATTEELIEFSKNILKNFNNK